MQKYEITIGADPEVFLKKRDTGEYYPGVGLIGGTKEEPLFLEGGLGALQEDNVMAEFNVVPSTTSKGFVRNTTRLYGALKGVVEPHGLETCVISHATFDKKYLTDRRVKYFGCDPDVNLYHLDTPNQTVNHTELLQLGRRVAGGHIHIGILEPDYGLFYLDDDPMGRTTLAKACELYIGLPSVFIDDDTERKKYYGRAGSFRPKPYGLEYRVLSNFWLKSQAHMKWAFSAAKQAANQTLKASEMVHHYFDWYTREGRLEEVINNKDREGASILMEQADIPLPDEALHY